MQILQAVEQRLPDWCLLELDRRALQELPTNKRKTTSKREPQADVREVLEKLANSCRVLGWTSSCDALASDANVTPDFNVVSMKSVSPTLMSGSQKPFPEPASARQAC